MNGKLVRDRIPDIIRAQGQSPVLEVADQKEYREYLRAKLQEEVGEYLDAETDSYAVLELADILEVAHALARVHGMSPEILEDVRATKSRLRGGFGLRIIWFGNA